MPLEGKEKAAYMRRYMALKRAGLDPVQEMARLKAKETARRSRKAAETKAGSNQPAFRGAAKETEPVTKHDAPVTKQPAYHTDLVVDLTGEKKELELLTDRKRETSQALDHAGDVLRFAAEEIGWPPIKQRARKALAVRLEQVLNLVEDLRDEFIEHEDAATAGGLWDDDAPEK